MPGCMAVRSPKNMLSEGISMSVFDYRRTQDIASPAPALWSHVDASGYVGGTVLGLVTTI